MILFVLVFVSNSVFTLIIPVACVCACVACENGLLAVVVCFPQTTQNYTEIVLQRTEKICNARALNRCSPHSHPRRGFLSSLFPLQPCLM